jgi:hypothetical protein
LSGNDQNQRFAGSDAMDHEMSKIKATANAHMRRDMAASGKWACGCEACTEMRSLTGMDKVMEVRPLVREIQQIEDQVQGMPEGPAREALLEQCYALHDKLAEIMAQ